MPARRAAVGTASERRHQEGHASDAGPTRSPSRGPARSRPSSGRAQLGCALAPRPVSTSTASSPPPRTQERLTPGPPCDTPQRAGRWARRMKASAAAARRGMRRLVAEDAAPPESALEDRRRARPPSSRGRSGGAEGLDEVLSLPPARRHADAGGAARGRGEESSRSRCAAPRWSARVPRPAWIALASARDSPRARRRPAPRAARAPMAACARRASAVSDQPGAPAAPAPGSSSRAEDRLQPALSRKA